MARGCDHSIWVDVAGRRFIVEYDSDGEVLRIKERVTYEAGRPWERIAQPVYWSATSHSLGKKPNTLPKQIIAAADAKRRREDVAERNTP